MAVMDSTEAQLRFGSALSATTDPSHPGHPLYVGTRTGRGSTSTAGPPTSAVVSHHHHHHAPERPTFRSEMFSKGQIWRIYYFEILNRVF